MEPIVAYQRAFLLLQPLAFEDRRIQRGEANKSLTRAGNSRLGLTVKAANQLRDRLIAEGYLAHVKAKSSKNRMVDFFTLTDKGFALLAESEQYPGDLTLSGRAINALLCYVRDRTEGWQAGSIPVADSPNVVPRVDDVHPTLSPKDFELEVAAILGRLEQRVSPLQPWVPIHALRAEVRDRLGPKWASPDNFDPLLKNWWRQGTLHLIAISDPRDATPEQLRDSLPSPNETYFYLERNHAPVVRT